MTLQSTISDVRSLAREKVYNARIAFTSRRDFVAWLRVPKSNNGVHRWSNEDLDPTPPERRNWRWYNYVIFYWALSFGNWTLGSTMIGIGLNWYQAILVIFLSQVISSLAQFAAARVGSVYHIGFPVVARSVFGMWGALYYCGARAALAIIWYGVQLYAGSSLVANMLRAVFGHRYTDIPNHIPESVGITTAGMLAFFLFWLAHMPFTFLRPYHLKWFFNVKTAIMIPAVGGLFIFCMANTHGNIGLHHLEQKSGVSASSGLGWFFVYAINSGMGNTATLITNSSDLSRWSTTRWGAMWSQLLTNPIAVTLSASLGILSTAAINNAWGLELWNQWDLIDAILTRYWSPSTRFACLLVAFGWSLSILGTNVAANMIPFGSDSTLLFPKYLTIPRGQFLVELLGFAICPWKILASASVFTTFLAGYGLFMASVVAIMVCDYFLLTKGNVFLSHAYDPTSSNKHYYYTRGWNIQAIIAYLCGVALPFPGFVGTLGASVSGSAQRLGDCGWMLSFVTSFVVYYVICCVVPTANQKLVKQMGLRWEEMADREIEVLGGVEEEYGMKPVATPSERNANGNGNGRSEKGVARQTMRPRTRTSDSR